MCLKKKCNCPPQHSLNHSHGSLLAVPVNTFPVVLPRFALSSNGFTVKLSSQLNEEEEEEEEWGL